MGYKIISKFIKDISFEIPNSETFLMIEKEISKYNLNVDIKSKPFKNNVIEVNTLLKLSPTEKLKYPMLCEICFSCLVSIDGTTTKDKKELEKVILIEVPKNIYPALYDTFVYLFSQAGLKNIQINKDVDFEKMYRDRK